MHRRVDGGHRVERRVRARFDGADGEPGLAHVHFQERIHGRGLAELVLSGRGHRLLHERVGTGDVTDGVKRSGANQLSLHTLARVSGLLDERLTECGGTIEIPGVVGGGPGNLERLRIAAGIDRVLRIGLRRIESREP